jgi:CDGSH-type Zn-finger protein
MDPLPAADGTDEPPARITPYPDGPLIVRGDFMIIDLGGEEIPSGRAVALCRCGRSGRKPFCDGSHNLESRAQERSGNRS